MPPKKGGAKGQKNATAKKADQKARQKLVEDKTFGLKNKNKSKKIARFVAEVEQGQGLRQSSQQMKAERERREYEKRAIEEAKMMASLNRPVIKTKVPIGVDPKSRVCEYFKVGQCTKGASCKFSHDLAVERKADKRSIHDDVRDPTKEQDTMEAWDQNKLEAVVSEKQTGENRNLPTKIVCKHFLKAIEESKYGWFWECPNGGKDCMYVHALPPGFVMKKKKNKGDESSDEEVNLEAILEEERGRLTTHTPLTLETFVAWKAKKKLEAEAAEEAKRKEGKGGNKNKALRSGRALFEFDSSVFIDDDAAADDIIRRDDDDDDSEVHVIEVTGTSLTRTLEARKTKAKGEDENAAADDAPVVPVDEALFDDDVDLPSSDEE